VSDQWNYAFFQCIQRDHGLFFIVEPLALGTTQSLNLGSMLLANKTASSIPCIVSNTTPSSIEMMIGRYANEVKSILHYPTIRASTGTIETPMLNTLSEWWTVLYRFVSQIVDCRYSDDAVLNRDDDIVSFLRAINATISLCELKDVLTMMHFNNVVHESYSNAQHTYDAITMKHTWVCHKHHSNPSIHAQDRLVDLLVGTSGTSIHYDSSLFNLLQYDAATKTAVFNFQNDLCDLGNRIEANTHFYVQYLHPRNVACSITW